MINKQKINFLVLDDDEHDLKLLERILKQNDIENYHIFNNVKSSREAIAGKVDVIILDHYLPEGETGLNVLKQVRNVNKWAYAISVTGMKEPEIMIQYMQIGVNDWVDKTRITTFMEQFDRAVKKAILIVPKIITLQKFASLAMEKIKDRDDD